MLLIATGLSAQQLSQIRLQDPSSNDPVTGATFRYGDQHGSSDQEGRISFRYDKGRSMQLSHVGYGQWVLSDRTVQKMIRKGVLLWKKGSMEIHPVTVIGLHAGLGKPESLQLDYMDRMAHDGGVLIDQVPAISGIRKSGGYGFDPVLRGFKYDQLNVVLNGCQYASAACPNRMDPPTSQMAPNMIERVEILKGPHALRYGSAFGGTLNFIPASLRFSEKPDLYGRLSAGYESNGNILRSEGVMGFGHKRVDIGLFASWSEGNDYLDGDRRVVQSGFSRGSLGMNMGLKVHKNQELRISVIRNLARDADFPALPMDLRKDDTWMYNLQHEIRVRSGKLRSWKTMVFGSRVNHFMDNLLKPLDPRTMNAKTAASTRNYGGHTEGTWNFESSILYAGMDLRIEGAEGIRTREFLMGPNAGNAVTDNAWQNSRISKTGIFSEFQFHHDQTRFILSARMEANHAEIMDPDPGFDSTYPETKDTRINPSVSIGAIKSFLPGISLGLWMGRATRSGSLTEKYINYFPVGLDPYEMLGNPGLKPEVNNQLDVNLKWSSGQNIISLDLFSSLMQDHISSVIDTSLSPRLPGSPGVRRFENLEYASKAGFEFSWSQMLVTGLQHQMGFAYTYGQDLERGEPLPEIAPFDFRYSLTGNFIKGKLHPEILFRYVLQQSRISAEYGETITPAFSLMDLRLSYQLLKQLRINAAVNNLFDVRYHEHLTRSVRGTDSFPIYAPGRSFVVSVNLDFTN